MRSLITGTGSYYPSKVLTNKELETVVDTTDEWIVERTGIRARRIAAEGEASSDLAYQASLKALGMAQVSPTEVDLIVVGTVTGDMIFPLSDRRFRIVLLSPGLVRFWDSLDR